MALRCAWRTTALLFLTIVLLQLILISHHIRPSDAIKKSTLKMITEILPIIALLKYLQSTSRPHEDKQTSKSSGQTSVIMPIIILPGGDYGNMNGGSMRGGGGSIPKVDLSSMGGFGGGSMDGFGSLKDGFGGGGMGLDLSLQNGGFGGGDGLMKLESSSLKGGLGGVSGGLRSGMSGGNGGKMMRMLC